MLLPKVLIYHQNKEKIVFVKIFSYFKYVLASKLLREGGGESHITYLRLILPKNLGCFLSLLDVYYIMGIIRGKQVFIGNYSIQPRCLID